MALPEGIDYSSDRPAPGQVKFLGKSFVCRYVGPGTGKLLTQAEAAAITAVGLSIVFLVEGFADDALLGYAKGVEHAQSAAYHVRTHDWPRDRPLYFAVDFDMSIGQRGAVGNYLKGCASVVGLDRVGVYGGIRTTEWAWGANLASWFFQTYAWSVGLVGNHTDIYQYRNDVPFAGGVVDLDRGMSTDYGQWPHGVETIGAAPATPAPVDESGPWDFAPDVSGVATSVAGLASTIQGVTRSLTALHG